MSCKLSGIKHVHAYQQYDKQDANQRYDTENAKLAAAYVEIFFRETLQPDTQNKGK